MGKKPNIFTVTSATPKWMCKLDVCMRVQVRAEWTLIPTMHLFSLVGFASFLTGLSNLSLGMKKTHTQNKSPLSLKDSLHINRTWKDYSNIHQHKAPWCAFLLQLSGRTHTRRVLRCSVNLQRLAAQQKASRGIGTTGSGTSTSFLTLTFPLIEFTGAFVSEDGYATVMETDIMSMQTAWAWILRWRLIGNLVQSQNIHPSLGMEQEL